MSTPPVSPKPRKGVRGYIREKYDTFIRSHSRSPSQQLTEASGSSISPTSPTSPTSPPPKAIGNFLAPPNAQAAQLCHMPSNSNLSAGSKHEAEANSEGVLWSGLRNAFEELRKVARPFPPLESAIGSLISCLSLLEVRAKHRQEYEEIALELKSLSEALTEHMKESSSTRMSRCIANVALGIEQQAKLINDKQTRGIGRQLVEASADEEEVIRHYRKIESLFRRLQTDANLSTWSIANEVLANTRLEGLSPAKLANYDSKLSTEISRRTCTEGTRTAIISEMGGWSMDPNSPDLYLMSGMAGTGKTTIACSFSNRLEERKQLAASFFCTRTSPECRDASRIVPTIAYQLARYSIPFQSVLCEVLGDDPDIGTKNIIKQFEQLVNAPLLRVKEAMPDNLVVVIDALDECEDRHAAKLVLELIFKFAPGLPLKFFVTSRPEPEIYEKMISRTSSPRKVLHLHEIEKSLVQADIELYLSEELRSISPTPSQIHQLAQQSGCLFIYAATLVRYIRLGKQSANPQKRLRAVLGITPKPTKKHLEIDALYTAILQSALDEEDLESEEVDDVRIVLWVVLCVQEPVPVETLAALTGLVEIERVLSALQPLRSVLHFSERGGLVSTLHASFPDFMFSRERSGPFFCNPSQHNQLIARQCFVVMKQELRFNICNLESSFVPDRAVGDLDDQIEKAILPALAYACRYWGDHLRLSANSDNLCNLLSDFLSNRLLFWMEVLSLKRDIAAGTEILVQAKQWLYINAMSPNLVQFAEDGRNFVTSYAANPVSQSTPHIYMSSLLLCPRSSLVYKTYWPRTHGLISLKGSGMNQIEATSLATWDIGSLVLFATYSPDGSRVAFGCRDGMVGVRNAYDGSPIIGPFKAHNHPVWGVAFSPDGTRFISASDDCTIKVWNVQDGTLIGEPLQGHTGGIHSATFSPDGRLIASGSADKTVRVWNTDSSIPVAEPFKGHAKWVWSVAFSPDSARIASGSYDHTIRVWNIQDGILSFDPLKGHTNTVWSVAFSPNGTQIVSGSADKTVRIWNAQNGTLVIGPLEGHIDEVFSVAFSPDGSRFVSSSRDRTIRIWSSRDGSLVAGPLEGHMDVVWSTAFSPDGMRVVSGGDKTIRVWNVGAGVAVANQYKGHAQAIWSVAFAPNDAYLASGSTDSIYTWDSRSGICLAGPFEGHTKIVRSVAVSSDGTRLISGSDDNTIRIWDVNKGTLITDLNKYHKNGISSVSISANDKYIASSSANSIRVQNSFDGSLIAPPFNSHRTLIRSIAFSPDGARIVSGSYDHTIIVWNTYEGTIAVGPFLGHTDWVMSVAFSPCGQRIVSGSKDCTIRVWNANDGTPSTGPFIGHTDLVESVAFSPDGTCIVSGSDDCTVRVWYAHSGELVAGPFYGHINAVRAVKFSSDGTRIASSSSDFTIRMWDVSDIQRIASSSEHPHSPSANQVHPPLHFENWIIQNGWITGQNGHMLFWAPPEIIRCLLVLRCSLIIGRFGTIEADLGSALLGERWRECYVSE
ncbi:hypothetical protein CTheo_2973 [Ceratobasidium theobromae]|uniref:Nephrocystin 3-like N-terminal domain-containing protein n=1 Tax=Ceratobasidium theobromae TaxID=1582974 RepID=A0A5N5QPG3_9AGAM|nr:hypothetical protein CTheo_2973 [Ceratobasidium theobromae]